MHKFANVVSKLYERRDTEIKEKRQKIFIWSKRLYLEHFRKEILPQSSSLPQSFQLRKNS